MTHTITRKYFVAKLPDITGLAPLHNERYYLCLGLKSVIRAQSKNNKYELEKKVDIDDRVRERSVIDLSKDEFDAIVKFASIRTVRKSYKISNSPDMMLRVYEERYRGLNRCEILFKTTDEADSFIPPSWLGQEITNTPLAKDLALLSLTTQQFSELLAEYAKS